MCSSCLEHDQIMLLGHNAGMTRDQPLDRGDAEAGLRLMGARDDRTIDLAEAALLFAVLDRPCAALGRYRAHLRVLGEDAAAGLLRAADDRSLDRRLEALGEVIFGHYGYAADADDDDISNANLIRVIDRRKGLPVVLGILCILAARAAGLAAAGINFPGRLLVRVDHRGERAMIDPSRGGRQCGAADLRNLAKAALGESAELSRSHYQVMSDRAVLLRLRNNVKFRLIQSGEFEQAVRVLDSMLLIAPAAPDLWHGSKPLSGRRRSFGLEHDVQGF